MDELTWEWTLAASVNDKIVAHVDAVSFVESVYVGQRLVSRSGHGGKPEGHTVTLGTETSAERGYRAGAPQEIVLKFDPARETGEESPVFALGRGQGGRGDQMRVMKYSA